MIFAQIVKILTETAYAWRVGYGKLASLWGSGGVQNQNREGLMRTAQVSETFQNRHAPRLLFGSAIPMRTFYLLCILCALVIFFGLLLVNRPNKLAPVTLQASRTSDSLPMATDDQSKVEERLDSQASTESQGSATNTNQTSVTVNGQDITVPENGQVHKTITSDGTTTHVDISSSNSTSGDDTNSSTRSSTNLSIHSNSHSSSTIKTKTSTSSD